jgi:hypothetical protein
MNQYDKPSVSSWFVWRSCRAHRRLRREAATPAMTAGDTPPTSRCVTPVQVRSPGRIINTIGYNGTVLGPL